MNSINCPFREAFTCEDPDQQTCLVCPNLRQFLQKALAAEEDRDSRVTDEELVRVDGHVRDDEN